MPKTAARADANSKVTRGHPMKVETTSYPYAERRWRWPWASSHVCDADCGCKRGRRLFEQRNGFREAQGEQLEHVAVRRSYGKTHATTSVVGACLPKLEYPTEIRIQSSGPSVSESAATVLFSVGRTIGSGSDGITSE